MVLAHHHFEHAGTCVFNNFLWSPDRPGCHHARTQHAATAPCSIQHAAGDMVHDHEPWLLLPAAWCVGAARRSARIRIHDNDLATTKMTTVHLSAPIAVDLRLEPDSKRGRSPANAVWICSITSISIARSSHRRCERPSGSGNWDAGDGANELRGSLLLDASYTKGSAQPSREGVVANILRVQQSAGL